MNQKQLTFLSRRKSIHKSFHIMSRSNLFPFVLILMLWNFQGHVQCQSLSTESDTLTGGDFLKDIVKFKSSGWFPQCYEGKGYSLSIVGFDVWDEAKGIRSSGFVSTTSAFSSGGRPTTSEETILQPNSSKESEDGVLETDFSSYRIRLLQKVAWFPTLVKLEIGINSTTSKLFSIDESRSFLDISGTKRDLKEAHTLVLEEHALVFGAGMQLPLYGGFLNIEGVTTGSYYFTGVQLTGSVVPFSSATQYAQILNPKEEVRYANGTDTIRVSDDVALSTLNRFRLSLELSLGWTFQVSGFMMCFEPYVGVPIISVLSDARWRQWTGGLTFTIGSFIALQ